MRVQRMRHPADAVEAEVHALRPAELGDGAVQAAGAVLAAEFAHDVFLPRHARGGQVRVEQEGPPDQLCRHVRPGRSVRRSRRVPR